MKTINLIYNFYLTEYSKIYKDGPTLEVKSLSDFFENYDIRLIIKEYCVLKIDGIKYSIIEIEKRNSDYNQGEISKDKEYYFATYENLDKWKDCKDDVEIFSDYYAAKCAVAINFKLKMVEFLK